MNIYEKILELLRCAFWGKTMTDTLTVDDFTNIVKQAEQQTILGLVFDVLKDKRLEDLTYKKPVFEVISKVENIKHHNILLNRDLIEFADKCNQVGIDYLVVKGQTVGCLYPKPELRQAGDIDFLFPIESSLGYNNDYEIQRAKMAQIFPEVRLPERMLEGEVGFKHNGIIYELHTSLRGWAKKRHQKVWDNLLAKEWQGKHYVEINGVKVRTLSPTMNAVYVFIHLFFHFIRDGVSLRQFCDWAMVLHHYKDEINKDALIEILSELGLHAAYRAFGTILTDGLGLPVEEFPLPFGENDRKWQDRIMKDIFGGGNFGKLHHQARKKWKYKYETMRVAIRNSFRYYLLCPSEVGGMIPRLVKGNLRIMMKR